MIDDVRYPEDHDDFLKREIRFEVGYDHRSDPDPKKRSQGAHGMQIRFLLHGRKGTIQFLLYTDWMPTWKSTGEGGQLFKSMGPMPADIGYHADEPQYEGQGTMECKERPSGQCYYDGSSLNAESIFRLFVKGGEKALWAALNEYYLDLFVRD